MSMCEVRLRAFPEDPTPPGGPVRHQAIETFRVSPSDLSHDGCEAAMLPLLEAAGAVVGDYYFPGQEGMCGDTRDGGKTWRRSYGFRPGRVY